MSRRETLSRYVLIIKRLKRYPATFEEIADHLSLESELQDYHFTVSKRTFQRDLNDIRALYNIDIRYDFSRKVYYIDYEDLPEVKERILEAFDVFNALNLTDRLSQHIHFEKRRPQGTENLYGLLHAIKQQHMIRFSYWKYGDEEPSVREVEPYALKEFKNRWYVVANDRKGNNIKTFALDRLTDLEITKVHFTPKSDFDVNQHFRYCFGIISPNAIEPEEVLLEFTHFQGKYIKSLPLHETQQILEDTNECLKIKLKIYLTHDFLMEILSYGENVKVLQPQTLIDEVASIHKESYQKHLSVS
jgi:predicted DNA-binding transcriptional regulator YafY